MSAETKAKLIANCEAQLRCLLALQGQWTAADIAIVVTVSDELRTLTGEVRT